MQINEHDASIKRVHVNNDEQGERLYADTYTAGLTQITRQGFH